MEKLTWKTWLIALSLSLLANIIMNWLKIPQFLNGWLSATVYFGAIDYINTEKEKQDGRGN